MMNLHKLSAGNGYTYLTRQVAANDAADTGYANLGEYYSERGESPGVWLGRGLAGLDGGPQPGDVVHEAQMVALFGMAGIRMPTHSSTARQRSEPRRTRGSASRSRYARHRANSGASWRGESSPTTANRATAGRAGKDEDRARLRSELGREWFLRDLGREPLDARELTDYVIDATRPGKASVAGYDLTFSPVKSVSALWALAVQRRRRDRGRA